MLAHAQEKPLGIAEIVEGLLLYDSSVRAIDILIQGTNNCDFFFLQNCVEMYV